MGTRILTYGGSFTIRAAKAPASGFGISRLASQLNRKLYDGFWLYHEAQKIDEWEGEDYDGTSVRAGLDILRKRGHCMVNEGRVSPEAIGEGIKANRWARGVDDVLKTLGYKGLDYVDVLNSWGRGYPHLTRMPATRPRAPLERGRRGRDGHRSVSSTQIVWKSGSLAPCRRAPTSFSERR